MKKFYDAGGGRLITVGTDHPSWGEYLVRLRHPSRTECAGGRRAFRLRRRSSARPSMRRAPCGMGDKLGTIEAGKFADLVVVQRQSADRHPQHAQHPARDGARPALRRPGASRLRPRARSVRRPPPTMTGGKGMCGSGDMKVVGRAEARQTAVRRAEARRLRTWRTMLAHGSTTFS